MDLHGESFTSADGCWSTSRTGRSILNTLCNALPLSCKCAFYMSVQGKLDPESDDYIQEMSDKPSTSDGSSL